jgi:hypothetical protein
MAEYSKLSTRENDNFEDRLGLITDNLNSSTVDGRQQRIDLAAIDENLYGPPLAGEENFGIMESDDSPATIRNDKPFPISKPPPKHRDYLYYWGFFIHFICIFLLSMVENKYLADSVIQYGKAGSWSSVLMIVILIGSFLAAVMSFMIGLPDIREGVLTFGVLSSIILKICIGNMLMILRSQNSVLGILVLLSAVIDGFKCKNVKEGINFSSALIQMVIDTTRLYGLTFFITCASIIFVQTLVLLWWGAYFISLLSSVSAAYAAVMMTLMFLSLYWITQFFHSFVAFVVGGSVLWTFVKEENDTTSYPDKLMLYVQCGLTTSLGSLCKAALFIPLSNTILSMHLWVNRRSTGATGSVSGGLCSHPRGLVSCLLTQSLVDQAYRHNRLALCLLAVYGRSFCSTAEDHAYTFPETLDICIEDSTYSALRACAVAAASVIAVVFSLAASGGWSAEVDSQERMMWPLYFFICYYLSYCGISLGIHVYSSAVDALIVSSALNPSRFAQKNQIVFLRFLRNSESGLR